MDSDDAKVIALDNEARAALEAQMRTIVGPVAIKGMRDKGALNLDSLSEGDEDFGLLDGMVYGGVNAKTRVIVTTDSLFRRWPNEHKNWWGKDSLALPQEPSAAVKDNDFYTQAVLTDAAIVCTLLTSRSPRHREQTSPAPCSRGGRVFIANTK